MKLFSISDIFGYQKLYGFVNTLHFQQFFKERFLKFIVFCCFREIQFFLWLLFSFIYLSDCIESEYKWYPLGIRIPRAILIYLLPFLLSSWPNILDYNSLRVRPFSLSECDMMLVRLFFLGCHFEDHCSTRCSMLFCLLFFSYNPSLLLLICLESRTQIHF